MKKNLIVFLFLNLAFCLLYAENVTFRADGMTGRQGENYVKLIGNASISAENIEIFADTIELYGEDYRYIKAVGNVTGSNSKNKMDFSSGELFYDRVTKVSTLQEGAALVDRLNDTVANAELMEYDESAVTVTMQLSVFIQQKNNICKGAFAIYNTESRTLFLSGNPQITQGTDVLRAQEIVLNLDTNEVTLDGRVRGSVKGE